MGIYLGLGANLGDRQTNLSRALDELAARGVRILRISPMVETPAMLPEDAPDDWNRPYLNFVVECSTERSPEQLLDACKEVEQALARNNPARWSPRPIDIDILLWDREQIDTPRLRIPHPSIAERNFVLTPLLALQADLTIPGRGSKTVLQWSQSLAHRIPLWMGIVNLTPDSFSDGGQFLEWPRIEAHIDAMVAAGAQIVDLGAESTRPGAQALQASEELTRLLPVLERLTDKYKQQRLKPQISVDTYHVETARQALAAGADIINDVSGLTAPGMIELAASGGADWVAMHHVTVPADPARTLSKTEDPVAQVERWLAAQCEIWQRAGIDPARVVFDPGIGFGKSALQSLKLLRGQAQFRKYGLRQLIGHSRKSFLAGLAGQDMAARDLNTIGISLQLAAQGVDILRVHNVAAHVVAYRGWSHAL
jgi:2-amino-4-hydroxy-6-hydroxymethyldihydropteridine diphosphokinase/dihydropteroate synthase